ncbi:MAG TPA: copper resistance protein CopC [Nevskiaceae bacterium]|nr:copper resistance protein CopC [Nevskiaceae bacterium]
MRTRLALPILALTLAVPIVASAHAFPDNSSPHVGATVATSPQEVKVWFDGKLEPVFSTLIVKNAAGKQVSAGKGHVDPHNETLLETKPASTLPAGAYKVYWSVIARDGHHTEGHFGFKVK